MSDNPIDVKRSPTNMPAQQEERRPARRDPFYEMRRDMDRMLDRFWRGGFPSFRQMLEPETFGQAGSGFSLPAPAIDFAEDEKAYHLTAELPGMSEKDINLTVSDDVLTISGEKREEKTEKEKDYHYSERSFGSFRRSVQLPQHIDRGQIDANFKNGILTVTLPKTAEASQRQRKIEIKAGQ